LVLVLGSWFWFLVLVLAFGSWFWFLFLFFVLGSCVLVLGFGYWFLVLGSWFWFLVLVLGFGSWFWFLVFGSSLTYSPSSKIKLDCYIKAFSLVFRLLFKKKKNLFRNFTV